MHNLRNLTLVLHVGGREVQRVSNLFASKIGHECRLTHPGGPKPYCVYHTDTHTMGVSWESVNGRQVKVTLHPGSMPDDVIVEMPKRDDVVVMQDNHVVHIIVMPQASYPTEVALAVDRIVPHMIF